jgi:ribonuclease D
LSSRGPARQPIIRTSTYEIHPLITDSEASPICAPLAKADFVTVDTEFMRENTYWPELCLVQIADEHEAAAIDPLAPGLDLTPLLDLMTNNEDVLKVFHAGGQDRGDHLQPHRQARRTRSSIRRSR